MNKDINTWLQNNKTVDSLLFIYHDKTFLSSKFVFTFLSVYYAYLLVLLFLRLTLCDHRKRLF